MSARDRILAATLLATALLPAAGGCQKSLWVHQYPEFYSPQLKTVAVAPFVNKTGHPRAGDIFAADLALALRANGTYQVIGPEELHRALEAKDFQALSAGDVKVSSEILRKATKAQAFVSGQVLDFSAWGTRYLEWDYAYPHRYRYYYGYRPRGYWYYGPDYAYDYFFAHAHVLATACLINVEDASTIHAVSRPVEATVSLSGYRPRWPGGALDAAMAHVQQRLLDELAVVPVQVKLKPGQALRTAGGQANGQWAYTDQFGGADEKMYVVLRLPPVADRNSFRITITPKGQTGNVLDSEEFAWSANDAAVGFEFSPRKLVSGPGAGTYSANFHAGGQLVMSHDFRIR